jgi:hypothetical protein
MVYNRVYSISQHMDSDPSTVDDHTYTDTNKTFINFNPVLQKC